MGRLRTDPARLRLAAAPSLPGPAPHPTVTGPSGESARLGRALCSPLRLWCSRLYLAARRRRRLPRGRLVPLMGLR